MIWDRGDKEIDGERYEKGVICILNKVFDCVMEKVVDCKYEERKRLLRIKECSVVD